MITYYCDHFSFPLPAIHTFPLAKYAMLRHRLLELGILNESDLIVPAPATTEDLLRVHSAAYLDAVLNGNITPEAQREIGLPWSPELVQRALRSVGGTLQASRTALRDGISANLAGGTHHAGPARGAGFCLFNDAAVAARHLQAEKLAERIVILDCDVHQGDGTAEIFENDPSVFTFSVHGARNYPLRKRQSDLDIPLDDGAGDLAYLHAVEEGTRQSLMRADADLAIYLAGADPYFDDRFGRLKVTPQALAQRDRLVFAMCADAGLPVVVTLAGGYARRIEDTVAIQTETIRQAASFAPP